MPKTYLFPFDIVVLATSSQPHIHCLPQFCSDCACCLVCKRRHGGRVVLLLRRLVVPIYSTIYIPILLNDDAFVIVIVSSIQTNRAKCALYKNILDLLDEESVLEEAVVELVYKFDEKSYHESIAKVRFKFVLAHKHIQWSPLNTNTVNKIFWINQTLSLSPCRVLIETVL